MTYSGHFQTATAATVPIYEDASVQILETHHKGRKLNDLN